MEAVEKTGEGFEIDIGMIVPITGGLFTDLVRDLVKEYLNLINRSVRVAAAVGS